jgi:hypothetical protein
MLYIAQQQLLCQRVQQGLTLLVILGRLLSHLLPQLLRQRQHLLVV